jgi:excisionase family DNA binding protein
LTPPAISSWKRTSAGLWNTSGPECSAQGSRRVATHERSSCAGWRPDRKLDVRGRRVWGEGENRGGRGRTGVSALRSSLPPNPSSAPPRSRSVHLPTVPPAPKSRHSPNRPSAGQDQTQIGSLFWHPRMTTLVAALASRRFSPGIRIRKTEVSALPIWPIRRVLAISRRSGGLSEQDLGPPSSAHEAMTAVDPDRPPAALISVPEAASRLGTPTRFVRRLVAERRIGFTKVGRYVRFAETDLEAFIAAGRVDPIKRHR